MCQLIHLFSVSVGKLQILLYLSQFKYEEKKTQLKLKLHYFVSFQEGKACEICSVVQCKGWKCKVVS